MNRTRPLRTTCRLFYHLGLKGRRLLPKQRCRAFGSADSTERIGRVFVINLDRQPGRWAKMRQELDQILDCSGDPLTQKTTRVSAVDARSYERLPEADAEVVPFYTLGDQLLVEPQLRVDPKQFQLDRQILMSWPEHAVARSHIDVWRRIATGADAYALVLEDDAWFERGFGQYLERAWGELSSGRSGTAPFDLLYVSYKEVEGGAQKDLLSPSIFRPARGLWYLSGYVLSRDGARKLLQLLPCRGPVDLWMNHQFDALAVRALRRSLVSQRSDWTSTNSYSILPELSRIGVLDCEGQSLFQSFPQRKPVFAFGSEDSGLTSLAMALSMLGYRCCSDLQDLPEVERTLLLTGSTDRVFDAYVNIRSLEASAMRLEELYPSAKFLFTTSSRTSSIGDDTSPPYGLSTNKTALLRRDATDKWKTICEHLGCAPPSCSFPQLDDLGQRALVAAASETGPTRLRGEMKHDLSPWVVEQGAAWSGIRVHSPLSSAERMHFRDSLDTVDSNRWLLRDDTFPGNLGLFRPRNVECQFGVGAVLSVRHEPLGVRDYSCASISSRDQYLFGRFEATLRASRVPGVVTGFFLHRDSPRQEIDVEIVGKRSDTLLVNVFYNPGDHGAKFDYGYRGTPTIIELGFDASESSHRFAIEWSPGVLRWFVDDRLVHERGNWNPTPIPCLPMTLHINIWPSRSRELAGRLNRRRLPATAVVQSIVVEADLANTQLHDL